MLFNGIRHRIFSREMARQYYGAYYRRLTTSFLRLSHVVNMPRYCCVPGCGRYNGHRFPKNKDICMKWRVAIKRIDPVTKKLWNPGKEDIVCHYHFTEDDYRVAGLGERCLLKPDAVPSVFDFKKKPQLVESARSKRQRVRESTCTSFYGNNTESDVSVNAEVMDETSIQSEICLFAESGEVCVSDTEEESQMLDKESQCEIETLGKLSIEHLKCNDKMIMYYTGFNTYEHFMLFFQVLGPASYDLSYKCTILEPQDQLLMTLMKLRQAKEDIELAMFFHVSESTVSKLITTLINFFYFQLKELDDSVWPPMETIRQHMPTDFSKKFPKTRVILDATEQPIQKPSDVEAQSATWSFYKHKNTLKTMIGVTPNGAVSYISSAYGGSASDRQIIERSSLLDPSKFEKGDSIMADRGIMVQDLFANNNVHVNTPTLLKGKSQLEPMEVVHDRRVASKRIHVERVIGLAKGYKILKHDLPSSKVPLASRIVYVCFAISNFRNCIVDKSA